MKKFTDIFASACAPWLFALVLSACVSFIAVWFGALNQDEGWYVYAAQMVGAGKMPYRDFFYTQGPAMPYFYSLLSPVWSQSSPLHGLLGARIVTLALGFAATLCAALLARRLVPPSRKTLAGFAVFALLSCNLYHVYFTTIAKTYSLGSFFLLFGLLLIVCAMQRVVRNAGSFLSAALLFIGGMSLAYATGTRISLLLILPVVGFALLFNFHLLRWSFLWYGLGGVLGLLMTYGVFAFDPESREGLLAAQNYHAARGGFDPFFVLGSVSRLARGYASLGVVLFTFIASVLWDSRSQSVSDFTDKQNSVSKIVLWMLGFSFASVFCLQLSAPFPYDDYQVPLMGMLTVLIVSSVARRIEKPLPMMWFVALVVGLLSFSSPMLQDWATFQQDRFWSRKKEMTELAKLREIAREINMLDPDGKTLFTQDLYLAIETGRTVPAGMEMGPFCYFPDMSTEKAAYVNVLNRELMTKLVETNDCNVAACSGYAFAIAAPKCNEVDFDEQMRYFTLLRKNFELKDSEPDFGQNATRLLILKRNDGGVKNK